MSIKVEASRFAVLKVEDDDTPFITKNKPKKTENKKNIVAKNNKNKSKNIDNQIGKSSSQYNSKSTVNKNVKSQMNIIQPVDKSNPNAVTSSNKKVNSIVDQWEQWKEIDEKFVEHEFQEQIKLVLQESKKDNLKSNGKKTVENNIANQRNITNVKEELAPKILVKDHPRKVEIIKEYNEASASLPSSAKTKKDKLKNENPEDDLAHLSYDDQIEIKNQSILEIKKIIDNIQLEIGEFKSKNQRLCQYLLQGESTDVSDLELEISNLREKHKLQTQRLTQLTTDLEKERSKGHILKSELNKIKIHKETSSK